MQSIKFFLGKETQTNIFGRQMENSKIKNQNKESAFGAAMAIFPLTNEIKHKDRRWLFIQLPLKKHDEQISRMPAVYVVSCDCQMFQVNYITSLVSTFWRGNIPNWKIAVWFFALCLNDLSFRVLTRQTTARHVARTRPQSCSNSGPVGFDFYFNLKIKVIV